MELCPPPRSPFPLSRSAGGRRVPLAFSELLSEPEEDAGNAAADGKVVRQPPIAAVVLVHDGVHLPHLQQAPQVGDRPALTLAGVVLQAAALVAVLGCVAIAFVLFAAWKRILRGTLSAAAQSPGPITCRSTPNRAALRLPAAASLHGEKRGGERALGL